MVQSGQAELESVKSAAQLGLLLPANALPPTPPVHIAMAAHRFCGPRPTILTAMGHDHPSFPQHPLFSRPSFFFMALAWLLFGGKWKMFCVFFLQLLELL